MTGVGQFLRLAWRRDRVMISVTLAALALLTYYSAIATLDLYTDEAQRVAANTIANQTTSVVAMYGHITDPASIGGIGSAKLQMLAFLTIAILVIAIVRRHTRVEEESGRYELLAATPASRSTGLSAAVLLAGIVSVVAGVLTALTCGWGGFPWAGSWALGLSVAGVGLAWTGLAAVAVQLSANNGVCGAYAFGSLGVAFLLRMIGDVRQGSAAEFLVWLSPLGWGQQVRAFNGERWWPLALPLALFAVCLVAAVALLSRRDLGAGLLADRVGRDRGRLGTAYGLALRLARGNLIGWIIAVVVLGVTLGSIEHSIGAMLTPEAEDMLRKMGGIGNLEQVLASVYAAIMALAAAVFGVVMALRLRSEESAQRAEPVLVTKASRLTFLASYGLIATIGSAALLTLTALSHWAGAGAKGDLGQVLATYLVPLPAVWLCIGIAVALYGWLPRLSYLAIAALAAFVFVGELGGLVSLPDWVMKISPFMHVPRLPAEDFRIAPVAWLLAITVVLVGVGVIGFRRRDVPAA